MVVQSLQDAEVPRSLPTSPSAAQMRCLLSVVRFLDGMAQELVRTEQKPRRRAKERNPSSTVTVIGGVQEDGTHLVSRKCQNDKSLHILHLSLPWKTSVGPKTRAKALEACKEAGSEECSIAVIDSASVKVRSDCKPGTHLG